MSTLAQAAGSKRSPNQTSAPSPTAVAPPQIPLDSPFAGTWPRRRGFAAHLGDRMRVCANPLLSSTPIKGHELGEWEERVFSPRLPPPPLPESPLPEGSLMLPGSDFLGAQTPRRARRTLAQRGTARGRKRVSRVLGDDGGATQLSFMSWQDRHALTSESGSAWPKCTLGPGTFHGPPTPDRQRARPPARSPSNPHSRLLGLQGIHFCCQLIKGSKMSLFPTCASPPSIQKGTVCQTPHCLPLPRKGELVAWVCGSSSFPGQPMREASEAEGSRTPPTPLELLSLPATASASTWPPVTQVGEARHGCS